MLKNHIKIAWRNLLKNKGIGAVNILGLTAGLSSFIIMLLFLNYELSYDSWDESLDRVYKLSIKKGDDIKELTPAPLAKFLTKKHPNVAFGTAIQSSGDYEVQVDAQNRTFFQKGSIVVDSLFFKVFPYSLSKGSVETVFDAPNAAVISTELAQKLYGNDDPLGKSIKIYGAFEAVITGVLEQPSTPSHLDAHLLVLDPYGETNNFWENYSYETYIKTSSDLDIAYLEKGINRLYYKERMNKNEYSLEEYLESDSYEKLYADAVPQLHNYPKYGNSHIKTIQALFLLALLLMVTCTVNYNNLSIAKAMDRSKEVGVRKVLGAGKTHVILQFMMETTLICCFALGLALMLVQLALPSINAFFMTDLSLWHQSYAASLLGQTLLCLLVIIFLSGLYPAFFLSKFNTAQVFKGISVKGRKGMVYRNLLIVIQFVVASFFVIITVVVGKQLQFMQQRDKGFNEEHLIRLEAAQNIREQGFEKLKNELSSLAGVQYVSKTTQVPGDSFVDSTTIGFTIAGEKRRFASVKVSTDYFKALNVNFLEGRDFTNSISDQKTQNAIINQATAKLISSESSLGKTIYYEGCEKPMTIVGVVNDFNVMGAEVQVKPAVFTIGNEACRYQSGGAILIKANGGAIQTTLTGIEEIWNKNVPDVPIRYSFLDHNFEQLLASYRKLQKVISFFGVVAIIISLIGLFALTTYIARQRNKEIGVRKVLGAQISSIALLIGKDFVSIVALATLIGIPIGWWTMGYWLQNFAYKVPIDWYIYVMVALGMVITAFVTISIQTIRAAKTNPINSLKTE
ncbi:ABC transporter permease [Flagellimonas onchidii]|uniref:ABC transporter permease n=1 Tax=Flagellimonas onchidii TaxID=2562684 RepID=UPI0010A6B278|nr:ABC transporter permease [Allomuricauda onchidii]